MNKKIKIISPSTSFEIAPNFSFKDSIAFFGKQGFEIELGNDRISNQSDIDLKANAIHEAFSDLSTDIIICSFGGFHSINLIDKLDYELIKQNPKPFFGFSDITVLLNAIYCKTGMITYYGPLFLSFLTPFQREYTLTFFNRASNNKGNYELTSSSTIIDYDDKDQSTLRESNHWVIKKGSAKGPAIGGHVPTFNLLQGTEYFPDLKGKILLLEMNELDASNSLHIFSRLIKSLQIQSNFKHLNGVLIGAFHSKCEVTFERLKTVLKDLLENMDIPVIANCNFGHILPISSIPIGGEVIIETENDIKIKITNPVNNS